MTLIRYSALKCTQIIKLIFLIFITINFNFYTSPFFIILYITTTLSAWNTASLQCGQL